MEEEEEYPDYDELWDHKKDEDEDDREDEDFDYEDFD
jgi:hypothetical protein